MRDHQTNATTHQQAEELRALGRAAISNQTPPPRESGRGTPTVRIAICGSRTTAVVFWFYKRNAQSDVLDVDQGLVLTCRCGKPMWIWFCGHGPLKQLVSLAAAKEIDVPSSLGIQGCDGMGRREHDARDIFRPRSSAHENGRATRSRRSAENHWLA